jgi:hypothetical protein
MTEQISTQALMPDPIVLSERERWGKNIVRYDAMIGDDVVGNVGLLYNRRLGEVIMDAVELAEEVKGRPVRGKGYGRQIYAQVPDLPLPDGSDFRDSGMRFVSSDQLSSGDKRGTPGDDRGTAKGLWDSLVRRGEAKLRDDGRYEYVVPPREDEVEK